MSERFTRCRGGLVLLAVLLVAACDAQPEPPPQELIGVWVTAERRYADRSFEVRRDSILFGRGEHTSGAYHRLLDTQPVGEAANPRRYRLLYEEFDGATASVEIDYSSQPRPSLQFSNRREIWNLRTP